eukprot:GHVT01032128.1.p1 GENE.GHVT01032128.1~~GHVT01032128.1.p1  ORF type:complete len:1051 (-),score=76.61 GHVT01032128.1:7038-10190(-)
MVAQLSSPCSLSFQNCHLVRPACSIVAPESPCKRPMASPFSDVQGPLPPPGHAEEPQLPPVGHRVMMEDGRLGTVRWVGRIIPPVRRTKKERETRVVAHPLNEHVRGVCVPPSALCEDTRTCYLPAAVGAGRLKVCKNMNETKEPEVSNPLIAKAHIEQIIVKTTEEVSGGVTKKKSEQAFDDCADARIKERIKKDQEEGACQDAEIPGGVKLTECNSAYTRPASWWIGVEWDDHHAGKHDGCIDGTRYFRCSHPHVETYKTAASFVRPEKIRPVETFASALRKRYQHTLSKAEEEEMKVKDFRTGRERKIIFVGKEQIEARQSQLEKTWCIGLEKRPISLAGDLESLNLQSVEWLSLRSSLITWSAVEKIIAIMPKLKGLNLDSCRLNVPELPCFPQGNRAKTEKPESNESHAELRHGDYTQSSLSFSFSTTNSCLQVSCGSSYDSRGRSFSCLSSSGFPPHEALESLEVSRCLLTKAQIQYLCGRFPSLFQLDLGYNHLSASAICPCFSPDAVHDTLQRQTLCEKREDRPNKQSPCTLWIATPLDVSSEHTQDGHKTFAQQITVGATIGQESRPTETSPHQHPPKLVVINSIFQFPSTCQHCFPKHVTHKLPNCLSQQSEVTIYGCNPSCSSISSSSCSDGCGNKSFSRLSDAAVALPATNTSLRYNPCLFFSFAGLRNLRLAGNPLQSWGFLLHLLSSLPRLRQLDISGTNFTDKRFSPNGSPNDSNDWPRLIQAAHETIREILPPHQQPEQQQKQKHDGTASTNQSRQTAQQYCGSQPEKQPNASETLLLNTEPSEVKGPYLLEELEMCNVQITCWRTLGALAVLFPLLRVFSCWDSPIIQVEAERISNLPKKAKHLDVVTQYLISIFPALERLNSDSVSVERESAERYYLARAQSKTDPIIEQLELFYDPCTSCLKKGTRSQRGSNVAPPTLHLARLRQKFGQIISVAAPSMSSGRALHGPQPAGCSSHAGALRNCLAQSLCSVNIIDLDGFQRTFSLLTHSTIRHLRRLVCGIAPQQRLSCLRLVKSGMLQVSNLKVPRYRRWG